MTQRVAELQRIREVRSHLLEAIAARRELFPEVLVSFTNFESAADVRDLVRRGLLTRPVDEIEPTPIGDGVLPRRSNALGLDQTRSWADHLEQEADQVQQLETFVADKEIPSAPGAALENHTMAYEEMLEPVEPLQEPSAHLFGQDMAHEPFHPAGVPGGIDIEEFGELINQQLPMEAPMEQPPLPRIMPRTLGDDDDDDEDEQFMVVG